MTRAARRRLKLAETRDQRADRYGRLAPHWRGMYAKRPKLRPCFHHNCGGVLIHLDEHLESVDGRALSHVVGRMPEMPDLFVDGAEVDFSTERAVLQGHALALRVANGRESDLMLHLRVFAETPEIARRVALRRLHDLAKELRRPTTGWIA